MRLLVDAVLPRRMRAASPLALVRDRDRGCARRRRTRPSAARPRRSPSRACARCAASCRSARRRTAASATSRAPPTPSAAAGPRPRRASRRSAGVIPLPCCSIASSTCSTSHCECRCLAHQLLARRQDLLRPFCESVLSHHIWSTCASLVPPCTGTWNSEPGTCLNRVPCSQFPVPRIVPSSPAASGRGTPAAPAAGPPSPPPSAACAPSCS